MKVIAHIGTAKLNETLSSDAQKVLLWLNRYCPFWRSQSRIIRRFRMTLINQLHSRLRGSSRTLTRREAELFYLKFKDSNLSLADEWFSGELFSADFIDYDC